VMQFAETVPRPPNQLLFAYFYLQSCQHSTSASSYFTQESQSPAICMIHIFYY
jgi:hypothetical protein